MGAVVKLNRWAAKALVAEAERVFENAAQEVWHGDESQRTDLDASVEILGVLRQTAVDGWPTHESPLDPRRRTSDAHAGFAFTRETLRWLVIEQTPSQEKYVADLERDGVDEPGYLQEQVYLLHVMQDVAVQAIHAFGTGEAAAEAS